jgi:DNA-binding CsgD family transcriptional regulator
VTATTDLYRPTATGDDLVWCPVAKAEVFMPESGICLFCRTDHSFAARLTEREREGMRLLAHGRTRKEIARLIGVSETSVANDWRNIRQKLNAVTTTQAVVMLVREGSA